MKKIIIICGLIAFTNFLGQAQLLKKFGQKVKSEVEYRAARKAGQKIDEGIDSVLALPKKIKEKNKKDTPAEKTKEPTKETNPGKSLNAAADNDENDMSQKLQELFVWCLIQTWIQTCVQNMHIEITMYQTKITNSLTTFIMAFICVVYSQDTNHAV